MGQPKEEQASYLARLCLRLVWNRLVAFWNRHLDHGLKAGEGSHLGLLRGPWPTRNGKKNLKTSSDFLVFLLACISTYCNYVTVQTFFRNSFISSWSTSSLSSKDSFLSSNNCHLLLEIYYIDISIMYEMNPVIFEENDIVGSKSSSKFRQKEG